MYPKGRLHEDEATTSKFLYDSKKVVVSNCALYAYFQNVKSITHTRSKKNEHDISVAYYERVAYFRERKEWDLYAKTVNFYTGVLIARGDSDSALEVKDTAEKNTEWIIMSFFTNKAENVLLHYENRCEYKEVVNEKIKNSTPKYKGQSYSFLHM